LALAEGAPPLADETPRALVQPLLEQPFPEKGASVHGKRAPYAPPEGYTYWDDLMAARSSVKPESILLAFEYDRS